MSLTDKLRGGEKYVRQVRSREHFGSMYLDELAKSAELKGYFFDEDGNRRTDDIAKYYQSELVRMMNDSYDQFGKEH